jgi:hypothetical protein
MEPITIQLAPGEVLALYSFLALGAHFAAVVAGENSPFSLSEISNHITTLGDMTSNTLIDKLAGAVTAAHKSGSSCKLASPRLRLLPNKPDRW